MFHIPRLTTYITTSDTTKSSTRFFSSSGTAVFKILTSCFAQFLAQYSDVENCMQIGQLSYPNWVN